MKKVGLFVGIVAVSLLALGAWQSLYATEGSFCQITVCGTSDETSVTESCVEVLESGGDVLDDASGGGAGLPEGVCKVFETGTPCLEVPECATYFARRQTPVLGGAGLLLTAVGLGVGGVILRRRKSRS